VNKEYYVVKRKIYQRLIVVILQSSLWCTGAKSGLINLKKKKY